MTTWLKMGAKRAAIRRDGLTLSSLPVLGSASGRIRSSRNAPRRAVVLIGVHALIAAHVAHWWLTGSTLAPVEPSEAMDFSIRGVINPGLVFFAAAILLTAIFGRFFCGWGCHLVALQDFCRWLLARMGLRPRPFRSRALLWVPLVAFAYMFLWPVVYRLWHGWRFEAIHTEWTTPDFWATFPGWTMALTTFVICGFATVYFLGAKGFCTYACPYGAIFGLADRLAPGRIRVTDACAECGHCTAVCTSNVRVHEEVRTWGMVVDSRCMKCMDCVSVCPNEALYFGFGRPALAARSIAELPRSRRPWASRGEEALLAILFIAAFLTFRGLYRLVPFLLSLGWAAILSYLGLQLARLATRPDLRIRRWMLKRGRRVTTAGWGFVAMMTLLGIFWGHSALVRYHEFRAVRADGEQAVDHLEWLQRWALVTDPRGALALGLNYVREGRLDEAQAILEDGLERSPTDGLAADLQYNLGMLELARGRPEAAARRFERALVLRPDDVAARENLAGVLCSMGQYREGLEHFRRAVELAPGDAATHLLMARAHLALGESHHAATELRRSLELDPQQPQVRTLLARLEEKP